VHLRTASAPVVLAPVAAAACNCLQTVFAAKIAIIVTGAVSALAVVVLSGVYTKRAIDKRLAQVHVHEEVAVEEQHYLLGGSGSSGGGAAAADEEVEGMRGVVVSVEAPRYVVERSSNSSGSNRELAAAAFAEEHNSIGVGTVKGWGRGVSGAIGGRWLGLFKQKARVSEDEEAGRIQPLGVSRSGSLDANGSSWEAEPYGHGSSGGAGADRGSVAGTTAAAAGGAGSYRAGKQQHHQQ
jgi:hypothetical protein